MPTEAFPINGVLILLVAAFLYFIPGIVASSRSRLNSAPIWMLNLFLGWTFVGWVIALIWAMTTPEQAGRPANTR